MNRVPMTAVVFHHRSLVIALLSLVCAMMATAPANASPAAKAAKAAQGNLLGDWEVVRVLVVDVGRESPGGIEPDDGREVGRKYTFELKSATVESEPYRCTLDTSMAKRMVSIKTLFAGEQLARPKLVRTQLRRRASDYALGSLARETIAIYVYQCEDKAVQLNAMGNWFAATKDTIIWPLQAGALAVMKRPPTDRAPEQAAFCATATLASDKTICTDRELWLMKNYTEAMRDCAVAERGSRTLQERNNQLDAYVTQRKLCDGDRSCIFYALREHASIVGQSVPSVAKCLESKKK